MKTITYSFSRISLGGVAADVFTFVNGVEAELSKWISSMNGLFWDIIAHYRDFYTALIYSLRQRGKNLDCYI